MEKRHVNLSVNVNKIALLRNSRGGNIPNVIQFAKRCEQLMVDGITVHPRPDARHIRYSDVRELKMNLKRELNVEGYPSEEFMKLVLEEHPAQVTLVPDAPGDLTSHEGWNVKKNFDFLSDVVGKLRRAGIRTSIFIFPEEEDVENAAKLGADRVELYTEAYAENYKKDKKAAIQPYCRAASYAESCNIGVNAGHGLCLENLRFFRQQIPNLEEVSVGHGLITEALYLGIEETISNYKSCLGEGRSKLVDFSLSSGM
ncbi:MAG TPA: pyridoxine 5'-phosphate synthase [Porphyromonadaceae bacterium]|nr:pyridoxine 5'-phosphate synthase [Porphyromonadaceae bacterium]